MSLSANIYVISGSVLAAGLFSPLLIMFSYLFCMHGNLWLDASSNFMFLGTGYFWIPITILELCSGMKINYLETAWAFSSCFYDLLGETRAGSLYSSFFPPPLRQNTSVYSAQCLGILRFSVWLVGTGTVPSWLWVPGMPLIFSDGSFPFLGSFSLTYALSSTQASTYRNPLQTLEFNLCVAFVSPVLSLANFSHRGSPLYFRVLNLGRILSSACVVSPCCTAWQLSRQQAWVMVGLSLVCFPSLLDHLPSLPDVLYSENCGFMYFVQLLVFQVGE